MRSPSKELDLVRRLLKPGGQLYLVYEPPGPERVTELAATLAAVLTANGFATSTHRATTTTSAELLCVVAQPAPGAARAADGGD